MAQIILNDEQAAWLERETAIVELRNASGRVIGYILRGESRESRPTPVVLLGDDQVKQLTDAGESVDVYDGRGKLFGTIIAQLPADEQFAVIKARRALASKQRRYTTAEVLAHLEGLSST